MFDKYLHAGDEQLIVSIPILWIAVIALISLVFVAILPSVIVWFSLRSALSSNDDNYPTAPIDKAALNRRPERRNLIGNIAAPVAPAAMSAPPVGAADSDRPYPAVGRRRGTSLFRKTSDSFRQVLSFALGSRKVSGSGVRNPRPKSSRSPTYAGGADASSPTKSPSSPTSKQPFIGAESFKARRTPQTGTDGTASPTSELPGQ